MENEGSKWDYIVNEEVFMASFQSGFLSCRD